MNTTNPPRPADWITLASRENSGALDCWDEYLCARQTQRGFVLNILAHELLGEVPDDWFDEEGELLPEHRDQDGALKLPEAWQGGAVVGYDGEGFLGELQCTLEDVDVERAELNLGAVQQALAELEWPESDAELVLTELRLRCPIYFDPHPLLVHFQSIIVRRSAVARSYPGGVEGFVEQYRTGKQEGQLFSLPCMSLLDVEHILAILNDQGIVPGQDIAVCDMHHGPLLHCDGIRFEYDSTEDFLGTWFAFYDPAYAAPEVPQEPCDAPEHPVREEPSAPSVPPEAP